MAGAEIRVIASITARAATLPSFLKSTRTWHVTRRRKVIVSIRNITSNLPTIISACLRTIAPARKSSRAGVVIATTIVLMALVRDGDGTEDGGGVEGGVR